MKKRALLTVLFLTLPVFLFAQTAVELENVLAAQVVTCAQAANFVLSSVGEGIELSQSAFDTALSKGWLRNVQADDAITLRQLSFLIMQAFDMRGGLMYSFFPGPRYAYRSMVSRSYIQGAADPAMTVSGERFLLILGRVLAAHGGEQ